MIQKSLLIAICGIPSICGSQKDISQQKKFRNHCVFSEPGVAKIVNKAKTKKLRKTPQSFSIKTKHVKSFINFQYLSLLWEIRNFENHSEKSICWFN